MICTSVLVEKTLLNSVIRVVRMKSASPPQSRDPAWSMKRRAGDAASGFFQPREVGSWGPGGRAKESMGRDGDPWTPDPNGQSGEIFPPIKKRFTWAKKFSPGQFHSQ